MSVEKFWIPDFPMPPSLNASYKSVRRGYRSSMIASPELRKFKNDVALYHMANQPLLNLAKETVAEWIQEGFLIKCDFHFLWPQTDIFTKTKKAKSLLKRLDADNRLKAGRDGIAGCLNIDDTYFIDGRTEKAIQTEGKTPCAIIVLSKTKIRNRMQILESYKATI